MQEIREFSTLAVFKKAEVAFFPANQALIHMIKYGKLH
jgi:hypothetical protein